MKTKITRVRVSQAGRAMLGVLAGVGVVATLAVLPGLALAVGPFLPKKRKYQTNQTIKRNLDSLVRSGLVERVVLKDGTERIELTKKGRFEALLSHGTVSSKKQKWDGAWRIVIFDVPNTKTKLRNELRRAMKLFGFISIQKSVWVYPYSCDDFLTILKSHLGVAHDVLYMKASYIENDSSLRKEFNI
jgi:DNA-binding transcriptional regulator PaaX